MRRYPLLVALLLVAANANAADLIGLKITEFGLEGSYRERQGVVWLQVEVKNNSSQTQAVSVRAYEAGLYAAAQPVNYSFLISVTLPAAGTQLIDVPLRIGNRPANSVLYAEALDTKGMPVGHAAKLFGHPTDGKVVGLFCGDEAICKSIRQTILFSGTAEEQTRKAQNLHLIQLQHVPRVWWAYQAVDTIVIAAPTKSFSQEQTDALEAFALRGGRLVLAEKEMGGGAAAQAPFAENSLLQTKALLTPVGGGTLVRISSISSPEFSNYFRPYGFAPSTPEEVLNLFVQFRAPFVAGPQANLLSWAHRRTATHFQFPGVLELILWMAGYLALMLATSFLLLRRMGKPEMAWVTIPALAILFSLVLYKASARNRPTEYTLDESRFYQLDGGNTLALGESQLQISAPSKGEVRVSGPGEFVYDPPQAYGVDFLGPGGDSVPMGRAEIKLGESWESDVYLRVWSFRNLSFDFIRRFPGSVTRTGENQITNSTGMDFQEGLLVTHDMVYVLGPLASGGVANLEAAKKIPYQQISGHDSTGAELLASPPFAIGNMQNLKPELDFPNGEWKAAPGEPFSLQEIVRGWPIDADRVFAQTKAVFFGRGKDVTRGSDLSNLKGRHNSLALYCVTYREWK